jgi:hypothetical protein
MTLKALRASFIVTIVQLLSNSKAPILCSPSLSSIQAWSDTVATMSQILGTSETAALSSTKTQSLELTPSGMEIQ